MRWFRRRTTEHRGAPAPSDPAAGAAEFWRRWADLLPEISAALGDGEPQRYDNELADAVIALHPSLQFSIERGQRALYALVLTGQEDPALRAYTDAWKAAAPAEDTVWEYHDSVPPVPDPTDVSFTLSGHHVALADVRVCAQVDEVESLIDVAVHHPALGDLPAEARDALTFLPLDATLGERLAASWLRRVEPADAEPDNAITLLELRELVHGLESAQRGD